MADLSASLWHASDVAAFAIDDAGTPVLGDFVGIEEVQEFSCSHGDRERTKGLAVLEDGNLDIGTQILRKLTSEEVGYHYRTC